MPPLPDQAADGAGGGGRLGMDGHREADAPCRWPGRGSRTSGRSGRGRRPGRSARAGGVWGGRGWQSDGDSRVSSCDSAGALRRPRARASTARVRIRAWARRERRGVRRAVVAAREPGLGVEQPVAVGSASSGSRARPRCRPRASRRRLGRGRAVRAVPGPGRAGPGAARHGLPRLRCGPRSRRGAEGAAPGVLRTGQGAGAVPGRGPAQARLRHPRIVPVYEAGRAGDRHYIAMALIEGRSLAERLAEDGPLPPATRRRASPPSWPRPWPTPTPWGSCTGTSSRPTSGSTTAATST